MSEYFLYEEILRNVLGIVIYRSNLIIIIKQQVTRFSTKRLGLLSNIQSLTLIIISFKNIKELLMKYLNIMAILLASLIAVGNVAASDDVDHKLVIQVSTKDPLTQKIALNNAANVMKDFGPGEVTVEIVAYGPGLSILTKKSKFAKRVASMAFNDDLTFSACNNTMKKIKKKKGHMPKLIKGVKVVPAGVTRIMELQEKGYSYVRP